MEKISKEELMAKFGMANLAENDLSNVVGDEKDSSVQKCIEDCMKMLSDYDRCRLLCKYGGALS